MPRPCSLAPLALLVLAAHAACGCARATHAPEGDGPAPTVHAEAKPVPGIGVAARVEITAQRAASVVVRYGSTPAYGMESPRLRVPENGALATILIGLEPGAVTHLEVVARATSGKESKTGDLMVKPEALPPELPARLDVTRSGAVSGYVLFSINDHIKDDGFAVLAGRDGRVLWYRRGEHRVSVVDRLPNGHFVMHTLSPGDFEEIELDGHVVRRWADPSSQAGTDGHEFRFLPNDHAFVIGQEIRTIDTRPLFPGGAEHATRFDQTATELTPDGGIAFRWSTYGRLSEDEITTDPTTKFDPRDYEIAHLNSIEPTPDGDLLVSLRDTSSVVKVDRETGNILFRLGGKKSDFRFVDDPLGGFSRQHDARLLANGNVLVFDNGNGHVPPESRPAEYRLDPVAKTATLVFQHRRTPPLFAPVAGSSRRLPNGNTLVSYGSRGVLLELDRASKPVWELRAPGAVFRATVVESMYP